MEATEESPDVPAGLQPDPEKVIADVGLHSRRRWRR